MYVDLDNIRKFRSNLNVMFQIRGLNLFHFRLVEKRGRRKKRSVQDLLEELKRDERVNRIDSFFYRIISNKFHLDRVRRP